MPNWNIRKMDGLSSVLVGSMPGSTTNSEVETALQRLVCCMLNEEEIIRSSLRRNHPDRASYLDRVGSGKVISYGHGSTYFIAIFDD